MDLAQDPWSLLWRREITEVCDPYQVAQAKLEELAELEELEEVVPTQAIGTRLDSILIERIRTT